jgi:hypothetical protein
MKPKALFFLMMLICSVSAFADGNHNFGACDSSWQNCMVFKSTNSNGVELASDFSDAQIAIQGLELDMTSGLSVELQGINVVAVSGNTAMLLGTVNAPADTGYAFAREFTFADSVKLATSTNEVTKEYRDPGANNWCFRATYQITELDFTSGNQSAKFTTAKEDLVGSPHRVFFGGCQQ